MVATSCDLKAPRCTTIAPPVRLHGPRGGVFVGHRPPRDPGDPRLIYIYIFIYLFIYIYIYMMKGETKFYVCSDVPHTHTTGRHHTDTDAQRQANTHTLRHTDTQTGTRHTDKKHTHTQRHKTQTHTHRQQTHTYTHMRRCSRCRGDLSNAMLAAKNKLQVIGDIKVDTCFNKNGPFELACCQVVAFF